MFLRRRRAGSLPQRMRISLGANIALLLTVAVLATAGIGVLLWWALGHPSLQGGAWTPANSFDFAKVVLAIVGGIGAVVALVVAYRKQHLGEAAEHREDTKLFAERFTKAADQLGSNKAPVRLAGMYALEGLAQGAPEQRQMIVNVLCAYLRMSYLPPAAPSSNGSTSAADTLDSPTPSTASSDNTDSQGAHVAQEENERREHERQVRLTAQRILAAHLRPGEDTARPAETFWGSVDLDLTGATLVDLDLSYCHIHTAQFSGAQFSGTTWFRGARFDGDAEFRRAQFGKYAAFDEALFGKNADFTRAQFGEHAEFREAQFGEYAGFEDAWFGKYAGFSEARFGEHAEFGRARFGRTAEFGKARFGGGVQFSEARFGEYAEFNEAQFEYVEFEEAHFDGDAGFSRARFGEYAGFSRARFGGNAGFSRARFGGNAKFSKARVRLDVSAGVIRSWPKGYEVADPSSAEGARLPGQKGRWGYLTRMSDDESAPPQADDDLPKTD